ncbi:hypothetical protein VTN77DRAFT_291 [Rasamsonia byssochlamydoides]|uniref:uncharacterized protein n=1 Tax=Rasamsonia byssochlamydoides TaxID=89139 RepID=UPI003743B9B2
MPFQRVIQDSDDEEDACSDVATSIDPLQDPSSQEDAPEDRGGHNVDFDRFLQSESSVIGDQGLTSSQQRREERWIPSQNGSVSVAALVSQRSQRHAGDLYSVDTQYTPIAGTADTMGIELPPTKKLKRDETMIDTDIVRQDDTREDIESSPKRRRTSTSYAMQDSDTKTYDGSEAAVSYNYFASLSPKGNTEMSSTMPFTTPVGHPTDQETEMLHLTPGRSKSLQPVYDSPPPTEPFSSFVSPQKKRSKSDLTDRNPSPKSLAAIQDEHHSSAETEITTTKRKRGRPKKQTVNEGAEEGLKAPPDDAANSQGQPNKRRPGRPRKSETTNKGHDVDPGDKDGNSENETATAVANQGNVHQNALNEQNVLDHDGENGEQLGSNERSDVPPPSSPDDLDPGLPAEMYKPRPSRSLATPFENHPVLDTTEGPGKAVKKKKIKRGKTTSAVPSKSHESDVEDDVLWIEDRPINRKSTGEGSESKPIELDGYAAEKDAGESAAAAREEQNTRSGDSAGLPSTEASGPEPKKRGRKRKKTNQEPTATELPSVQEPAQASNEDRIKPAAKNVLQDISNLTSPIKSDEKKPKQNKNHLIGSPEVVIVGDRKEEADDNDNNNTIQSSPHKSSAATTPDPLLETPKKTTTKLNNEETSPASEKTPTSNTPVLHGSSTTAAAKGPDKHSPIARTSKVPFRVGLSRKARIAPLLKVVRK